MRILAKIILVGILVLLAYSVIKLINTSTPQETTITTISWPVKQTNQDAQKSTDITRNMPSMQQNTVNGNPQMKYQADEILIDGQGPAGSNYIDITSDTPITPRNKSNTQQYNNNKGGGAYAQASVTIDNNNNTSTSAQTYAPGVPAFEVIDGN